ncbi:MAG TPA: threonine synthase [Firmicutes bacterium]|nr:threonine synthase [Bacillota bacterium]
MEVYEGVIKRYEKYLPVTPETPIITLYEGNTPLLRAKNIEKALNLEFELYLKYEGENPTGSFKDRGMTVAVSKAVEKGAKAVICASTGNTAASASAYAAKANIECIVIIPKNAIAIGKLSQSLFYGAKVIAIEGNFDDALAIVRKIVEKYPVELVNSINPNRIEGQKTASFEICDVLGESPDYLCIPVGNAGNITAYWKGFKEYYNLGKVNKKPVIYGFEAEGAAPIAKNRVIKNPQTIATAIRIGNPASWEKAVKAKEESKGEIDTVTDEEIVEGWKLLAKKEGIFTEPASAASIAGMIKFNKLNKFRKGSKVVCVLTGSGLKDPDTAIKFSQKPVTVKADLKEVVKVLKW